LRVRLLADNGSALRIVSLACLPRSSNNGADAKSARIDKTKPESNPTSANPAAKIEVTIEKPRCEEPSEYG
jgi:hypothetical protein